MTTCDYCGETLKIVYTCNYCRGKFCKDHKKPKQHNCSTLIKTNRLDRSPKKENGTLAVDKSKVYLNYKTAIDFLFSLESDHISPDSVQKFDYTNSKEYSTKPSLSISKGQIKTKSNDGHIFSLNDSADYESFYPPINYDNNLNSIKKRDNKRGIFSIKILLTTIMIVSIALNGVLYREYHNYQELHLNYMDVYNNSLTLKSYYETLTSQYSELRQEYNQISFLYEELVTDHNELEDEYYSIMDYDVHTSLEDGMKITIGPSENYSKLYQIPFLGVLDVSYVASGEVYVWVGSNELNEYYSRFPQFPETASSLDFTVPVYPDLIIYFANPNEFESITLTYSIDFTY